MKILVINAGSSSIKYQVFNSEDNTSLIKGIIEKIGEQGSVLKQVSLNNQNLEIKKNISDFNTAIEAMKDALSRPESALNDINEITAVGHRVVHGGEEFYEASLVDEAVLLSIEKYIELAPLHNPANLAGIKSCIALFPNVPNVAVFDTAFHSKMPQKAYLYAIPYELYKTRKIRRYGFHGTSHRYVSYRTAKLLNKDIKELRIITCHLGNGASITAVDKGVSVDTSMGFTPLEGIIMGTRCGDVDPAIVFFLMEQEKMDPEAINKLLNKKSGLLGVSGISNDMRDIKEAADAGNKRAKIALEMYVYKIQKYIGAFTSVMSGVDAVVFTAGVGENNPYLRELICSHFSYLGLEVDKELNESKNLEKIITTKDSRVKSLVIPTNEELLIAKDTYRILNV